MPANLDHQARYWKANLRLTGILLAIWCALTVCVIWFAPELNQFEIVGPMGFYMGAQGSLIVYLAIIWFYAWRMKKLDQSMTRQEEPHR